MGVPFLPIRARRTYPIVGRWQFEALRLIERDMPDDRILVFWSTGQSPSGTLVSR